MTEIMCNAPAALICVDLDGTAVDHDGFRAWFSDAVAEEINTAVRHGAAWCTNSGRNAHNQHGMVHACRALAAPPRAILAGERYIHDIDPNSGAMRPRQPHNQQAKSLAVELIPRVRTVLTPALDELKTRFAVAEYIPTDEFIGWQLQTDVDPVSFEECVRKLITPVPDARILRNGQWIIITHAEFGKGRLLAATAGSLGVGNERVLAIGDQPNDLDMLDGRCAARVGCPADADSGVKETVRRAHGWVAEEAGSTGTAALIRRFVNETLARS